MICFDTCDLDLPVIGNLDKTAPDHEPFSRFGRPSLNRCEEVNDQTV